MKKLTVPICPKCGEVDGIWERLDPEKHKLTIRVIGEDGRICHRCGLMLKYDEYVSILREKP